MGRCPEGKPAASFLNYYRMQKLFGALMVLLAFALLGRNQGDANRKKLKEKLIKM
jgi:hypothetical protein